MFASVALTEFHQPLWPTSGVSAVPHRLSQGRPRYVSGRSSSMCLTAVLSIHGNDLSSYMTRIKKNITIICIDWKRCFYLINSTLENDFKLFSKPTQSPAVGGAVIRTGR